MIDFAGQRRIALVIFAACCLAGLLSVAWVAKYGWAIHRLTRGVGDTVFHARDGRPWFRMDEQRQDVPLADVSPHLRHAVIAIEDHRFYRHFGIDPLALGRAVARNVNDAAIRQGGSTLTQQLARTLFLTNQRTWGRKIKEAGLALLLEGRLSKNQILELYLNRIYISAGRYGVETMSRHLFNKAARDLTLSEAALIAGLIRAPGALSPWTNPDGAVRRSHVVLARMREEGFITADQAERARRSPPRIRPYPAVEQARAGYAKEYLRQQFRNRFGGNHPPDWKVDTTLDPALQEMAERAVQGVLRRIAPRRPQLQAALVAMEPATGDILAMVGGRDFSRSQFNRAARSRRQPGSAFKPFVYASALARGYSPVSVLQGLASIEPQGPDEWAPRNANGITPDVLPLRQALVESDNRAATVLQQRIGARPVLALASTLGMRDLPEVPSLALGTGEVTPLELTTAYAVFANGGVAVRPRAIRRVADRDGAVAFAQDVEHARVLDPEVAFQMQSMLRDVMERGTGSAARGWGITFPVGGKTGTTDKFRDAWFVGFSSALVVGVWVGLDRPASIAPNAYGARLALPIWTEFMRQSAPLYRPGPFPRPAGLREELLCRESYLRAVEDCPHYTEYFKEGDDIPRQLCRLHEGSFKQQAQKAVQGVLSGIAKAIRGIFR